MTSKEMQIEFERRIQLISTDLVVDNKPTSDTIFSFLNAAQDRYIVLNFVGDDQNVVDTHAFIKNIDAIKSLVIEESLSPAGITPAGFTRFAVPTQYNKEYFLYVNSLSEVTGTYKNVTGNQLVPNTLIKYADLDKFATTAYNKPIIREPGVALMSDPQSKLNYLVVAVDAYTNLNKVILTYIRKPLRMNTIYKEHVIDRCELPESVHNEIVELAVEMFITEAKYRLNASNAD